jgi:hypothetical protein
VSTCLLGTLVMSNKLLLVLFIAWVGFAIICAWFADRRGRPVGLWALLGFIFAWFALIVLLALPNLRKRPHA